MKRIALLVFALLILRLIVSFIIWHPDLNNHMDWGIRFWEYGPKQFYSQNVWSFTWPNQPPGTIYMFAGVRKLFEFVFNIFWQLNINIPAFPSVVVSYFETNLYPALLKLPAILADFGIAYIIYKWSGKKWAAVIWLLNPIIWYNSIVWGQYDAVVNFLALLSFYLLTKRKLFLSTILIALSFYTKASLLIFAPVWIIYALRSKFKFNEYVTSLVSVLVFIAILSYPFVDKGNIVNWLYELYKDKVFTQQLHVITANAFNLWSAVAGIHERPDTLPFLGMTYQIWSYILFAISYIPLLFSIYKKPENKNLAWVLTLAAFSSFVLLTNMHERYLYPLFPYLTILLAWKFADKWLYWIVSLISLLNLYNFWFIPKIGILVNLLSFGDRLMPRVLGLVMFVLYLKLAKGYTESK